MLFFTIDYGHHQPKVQSMRRKREGAVHVWKQSEASEPPNLGPRNHQFKSKNHRHRSELTLLLVRVFLLRRRRRRRRLLLLPIQTTHMTHAMHTSHTTHSHAPLTTHATHAMRTVIVGYCCRPCYNLLCLRMLLAVFFFSRFSSYDGGGF